MSQLEISCREMSSPLYILWYNWTSRGHWTSMAQDYGKTRLNGIKGWNPCWYLVQQWLTTWLGKYHQLLLVLYSKHHESHIPICPLFCPSIWSLKALAVCLPPRPHTHPPYPPRRIWGALPGLAYFKWSGPYQELLEGNRKANTKLLYTWPVSVFFMLTGAY